MLTQVTFSAWTFVCYISLAASGGAILATRFDGVSLSARNFLYATAVPGIFGVMFVTGPTILPIAFCTLGLVAALTCLSVIDGMTRTVPDLITVPMIPLGLVHSWAVGLDYTVFALAALSIVVLGLLGQFLFRTQSWIGGGDVLLIAGATAWFGPALLPDLAIVTAVLLAPQWALSITPMARTTACVPVDGAADTAVPLAPSLGTAQLLIWFGGPLF